MAEDTAGSSTQQTPTQQDTTMEQTLGHALDGLETQAAAASTMVAEVLHRVNRLPDQPSNSGTSRQKCKLPPTVLFTGSAHEDVNIYLKRVDCIFDLWDTPTDQLMDLIPDSLGGHALEWYFRQPVSTRRSWDAFKLAIARFFKPTVVERPARRTAQ